MKETFYFSHDYNARNDEKILELRAEFGAEGYGIFWMLVESMAESSDGYLNRGAMGGLSLGYGVAKDTLIAIVDFCVKIELFLLNDDATHFYSKRLQEHKDLRKMLSEKGKQGAIKRWEVKQNRGANGEAISKGNAKESKGKKNKVNNNIEFDWFWNTYNKKVGLEKCKEKFKAITTSDFEAMKKHLPNYVESTPDKKFRKDPLTYLNQKSYLDEIEIAPTLPFKKPSTNSKTDLYEYIDEATGQAL